MPLLKITFDWVSSILQQVAFGVERTLFNNVYTSVRILQT
jgi:hypothetical protein